MSLESAIKELTEAVLAQTELIKSTIPEVTGKGTKANKKRGRPKKVVEPAVEEEQETLFPEEDMLPAPSLADLEDAETPLIEEEIIVSDQTERASTEPSEPLMGSAPVTKGTKYYVYCMNLCNQYSAATGDPGQTQKIIHKHDVTDISTVDDLTLEPLVDRLVELITELGEEPVGE